MGGRTNDYAAARPHPRLHAAWAKGRCLVGDDDRLGRNQHQRLGRIRPAYIGPAVVGAEEPIVAKRGQAVARLRGVKLACGDEEDDRVALDHRARAGGRRRAPAAGVELRDLDAPDPPSRIPMS